MHPVTLHKAEEYWADIDERLIQFQKNKVVRLKSLRGFVDLNYFSSRIEQSMAEKRFIELCEAHKELLKVIEIEKFLVVKLFELAKKIGYKGSINDQYHVARLVRPGDTKEKYRGHFDSHLFTIVLPLKIPQHKENGNLGELLYLPEARKLPMGELNNLLGKLKFRMAQDSIIKKNIMKVESFENYEPLLFFGNTTFHTNLDVSSTADSYRLTCLVHLFDPGKKYGVGNILRTIRGR